jgi:hypothetical protein
LEVKIAKEDAENFYRWERQTLFRPAQMLNSENRQDSEMPPYLQALPDIF